MKNLVLFAGLVFFLSLAACTSDTRDFTDAYSSGNTGGTSDRGGSSGGYSDTSDTVTATDINTAP